MTKWRGCCGLVLVLAGMNLTALAAQTDDKTPPARQSAKAEANDDTDEAAEKAVLDFVKEHQPELAELLKFMKNKKSKDYKEAMRESRKVRDRLVGMKDRDPELYAVELAIWKNAAQIRLLAASVSAKSNKLGQEDRLRLEELVKRENDLNIKRLGVEKARLESRIGQLSTQLTRRQEQAESVINKSLKTWEARIERSGKTMGRPSQSVKTSP